MAICKIDVEPPSKMREGLAYILKEGFRVRNTPERIIKSGRATIVFWNDGTKTIVKRKETEQDDPYLAFLAALGKKIYGSNSAIKRLMEEKTEIQKGEK